MNFLRMFEKWRRRSARVLEFTRIGRTVQGLVDLWTASRSFQYSVECIRRDVVMWCFVYCIVSFLRCNRTDSNIPSPKFVHLESTSFPSTGSWLVFVSLHFYRLKCRSNPRCCGVRPIDVIQDLHDKITASIYFFHIYFNRIVYRFSFVRFPIGAHRLKTIQRFTS